MSSTSGTQHIFKWLEQKLGPDFSYEQIQGSLLGRFEITNLTLHNKNVDIKIKHLVAHSSMSFFSLKLVTNNMAIEGLTLTPNWIHLKESSSSNDFKIPVQLQINSIVLKNTKLNLSKNRKIILPDLAGSFALSSKKTNLVIHKFSDENAYLELTKRNQKTEMNLKMPLQKTQWSFHYLAQPKKFNLKGEISGSQQSMIRIEGTGEKNTAFLKVNARSFNLQDIWPDYWPGKLNFNLFVTHDKERTKTTLSDLEGVIKDQPLKGNGYLTLHKNKIEAINLHFNSHDTKMIVEENKAEQSINWLLEMPQIQNFSPHTKGQFFARGEIEGLSSKPLLRGDFEGNNIIAPTHKIKKLNGHFFLNLKSDQPESYLQLSAIDFSIGKFLINNVNAEAKGAFKKHEITLKTQTKDQIGQVHLLGKYEPSQWVGHVDQLSLINDKQRWKLQKPFVINLDKKGFSIDSLLLFANQSLISLHGDYLFYQGAKGTLLIKNFELSFLNCIFPETFKIDGKADLNVAVNFITHNQLGMEINFKPGTFYYSLNNDWQKNAFTDGKLTAVLEKNKLIANSRINLAQGQLSGQISSSNFNVKSNLKDQPINGTLNLEVVQVKFLELLIPAIRNVTGNLKGSYQVAGTFANPLIKGQSNLINGSFKIPKLNLNVSNVNLQAQNNSKKISYQGTLMSGNGTLSILGQSEIDGNHFPIDLNLHGNNVLICDKPEIKILASPNMHLNLQGNELKLSGTLLIPEANLHPHDFGGAQSVSEDIIFIQQNGKKVENSNLKIISSIELVLGNKIVLNSHGIKGQVLGKIKIEDNPNKTTVAYGQLWLQDGSYKIYGKTLQIDDGKLLFTGGPITNPGLNIKASRTLQTRSNSLFDQGENIKVGVSVTGNLHTPKINLFSEPVGKSSEDILSYLILGMPVNSVNKSVGQSNTQLLLQAADALSLSGNSKFLNMKDKIKNGLGLAELDIGTRSEIDPNTQETVQHTAFVLGKYLSPKFYVNYSLDLFDHTNTLKVRYLLNKFWTIQSVANTNGSGVDILYTVERK